MAELSNKQRKQLRDLEKAIDTARVKWLATYETAKAAKGLAVDTTPGTTTEAEYAALVELREQRNKLLADFRAAGIQI